MKLHQESLRESHFEATVTRFEFPWRIGRKSEMKQVGIPWGEPGRQGRSPGFTKLSQDRTETRIKLKVARGQVARFCIDSAIVADVTPNSIYSTKCARASRALRQAVGGVSQDSRKFPRIVRKLE